ncbi:putative Ran exchange factor Prp20/Pim1 [Xylariomycetidae sp. FL2044]|nr:putative Ran exchange factor Prp20/Pim1 [Xylariomycetidae sp. FL2044]
MPSASASRTRRKIEDREHGSNHQSSKTVLQTNKTAQNVSKSSAKQKHAVSVAPPQTNKRKRSLATGNADLKLATKSSGVSKRIKTDAATSKPPPEPEQPTEAHSAIINKVPSEKLTILIFGGGESGELGLGPKKKESLRPFKNPLLDVDSPSAFHIVQLACGGMHTIALTTKNKIITWGVNDEYALGRDTQWDGKLRDIGTASEDEDDDDEDDELNPLEATPMEISTGYFPPGVQFVQVAAGDNCSFVLTDTGRVYGWGTFRDSRGEKCFRYDDRGEKVEKQMRPFLYETLPGVTQICCGDNHALALDTAGNIWAWGCNEQNQFGRHLYGRNSDSFIPRQVRVCRNKAKYIASGCYHSFAVDQDDNVWGWGANSFGEAGDVKTAGGNSALVRPTKIRDLCQKQVLVVDGGAHHSAAVTADGQCLVWGRIDDGQLGIAFTPEQMQDSALIRRDDYDKPRICLRPTIIPTIEQVTYVACNSDHTILLDQAGNAFATGYGDQGQLGLGSNDDVKVVQRITGKAVKDIQLTWAGAGAQFSIVAGLARNG